VRRLALLGLVVACHSDARFASLHEVQHPVADLLRVENVTLGNGMHVAVLRDPRAQIASIDLRFDVGVADDPKPGLALLVGELLAGRGSDAELTSALDVDLDRTDLASTTFDVDGALELAARRLETSCDDFDPYAIDAARDQAVAALTGVAPSLTAAVWGADHPYSHGLGDPKALAALTADDVCAFYRAHYGPTAATLVVSGAFDDNLGHRLVARFDRIAKTELAARTAIPPLNPTHARVAVWGLGKPTAALAFAMPVQNAADEVLAELAVRSVRTWDKALHVALVGGRRDRALVIGLEGERESDLPKLHAKLTDLVAHMPTTTFAGEGSAEDRLDAAEELDDAFERGADIADLVAAGRSLERLARAKAWIDLRLTFHWMRLHVIEASPRVLDLIPPQAGGAASIEALADPASTISHDLASAGAPLQAMPVRAIARPVTDYTLANGLRVVLAPDPLSPVVDARLVMPIGSHDEPAPGAATQAALELEATDSVDWDADDKITWYVERDSIQDAAVTPWRTRFRVLGLGGIADWHVWALAFRVTTGRFENGTGALARWKTHYAPRGSTLIVSGGFDPGAIRQTIDTWLAPWHAVDPRPIVHAHGVAKPVVEIADDHSLALELGYQLAKTPTAAALVLATIAQQRLAGALRGMMDASISYDVSDRRVVLAGEADPSAVAQALGIVDREFDRLPDTDVSDRELERARRIVIATRLGGTLAASGRARQLEERVLAGEPLDRPDTIVADAKAVTAADLRAAATELLVPESRDVAIHASKLDGDRVLTALGIDPRTALRR